MNWRMILGLVLLIVGVRVLYIAIEGSGSSAWRVGAGGVVWITVGIFLLVKTMMKKEGDS